MKSSIFATLVGLGIAGGRVSTDRRQVASSSQTSSTFTATTTSLGGDSLKTFVPIVAVGGGNGVLNGVSDLAATTLLTGANTNGNILTKNDAASIGTGSVLITSTLTGESKVQTGKVIVEGSFPKANLKSISSQNAYAVDNIAVAAGVINTANSQTVDPNLNLKNLFTRLPSVADVDRLILTSDSVSLLKLIQTVGEDNTIPCDQRIAYLLELNGRVKAAIQKKNYAYDQLKIVIDTAFSEITRLQALIQQNNKQIDDLGLDTLNLKLNDLLNALQVAYANYNTLDSQIPILEAQVSGSQKQIDILNKNSDNQRNAINNNKLKLNDILTDINTLQNQLAVLLDRQAAIQASIDKAVAAITVNDKVVLDLKGKIKVLQTQLANLNDQADKLNSQTQSLQVRVQRLRTDISVADATKTKYLNQISAFKDRISVQNKLAVSADLPKLNGMIDNLKRIVPTVQSEIDRHYYYCYGDGKVQVKTVGGVVVYVVRGDAFGNYLRNLYGRNVVVPAVNGDVLFNRIDIFDATWTGAFGYPFGNASLGGSDLVIGGSFGCTNPGSLTSGSGIITAIGPDWIECGTKARFNLGSCSRLQATRKIPAIGQKFYWSGVPSSKGYNVYAASCFD